ncbi:fluoride efflux transporter CrcB [Martelella sp. HB161492]|uniref:fluoride efflux transporter CrcB n=1 Tax=Martelella sp. HB161492 TaxID=2720726 RepID=UPI0015902156|nr:fluoride efflux transporter CrcB [Martelella sp. HB161492]
MGYLLVFIGAGVGGALRHGVNMAATKMLGTGLPYGTLAVNIIGSLVMGLVTEYWSLRSGLPQPARLFITTGMLGGFTTFSTFSLDTAVLLERGQQLTAFAYAATSIVVSLAALFAGLAFMRLLLSPASV